MTGARCWPPCCQRLRLPLLAHRRHTHQKCRPGFFHQLLTRSGSDINWATETGLDNITRKLRGYTTLQSKSKVLRSRWLETKCPCLPSLQFPQGQHNVYCRQSFQRTPVFLKSRSTGELYSWLHIAPPPKKHLRREATDLQVSCNRLLGNPPAPGTSFYCWCSQDININKNKTLRPPLQNPSSECLWATTTTKPTPDPSEQVILIAFSPCQPPQSTTTSITTGRLQFDRSSTKQFSGRENHDVNINIGCHSVSCSQRTRLDPIISTDHCCRQHWGY